MGHNCGKYHYGDQSVIRDCCVQYAKERKAATLSFALTEQHYSYRSFESAWNNLTDSEMTLVGDIRYLGNAKGFKEIKE